MKQLYIYKENNIFKQKIVSYKIFENGCKNIKHEKGFELNLHIFAE